MNILVKLPQSYRNYAMIAIYLTLFLSPKFWQGTLKFLEKIILWTKCKIREILVICTPLNQFVQFYIAISFQCKCN